VLGSLAHVGARNYGLTPRWDYLLEVYGRLYTVWGPEEAAEAYSNPPTGRARRDANLQYEANTQYDPAGSLGEGQYVWVVARTVNRNWLLIQAATGATYWTQAENIELFTPLDNIPLDE